MSTPAPTPSATPVTPAPAPTTPQADADAKSEADRHAAPEDSRRRSPVKARIHCHRIAPYRPGVVCRHVHHFRIGRSDGDGVILLGHHLLRSAAQVAGALCLVAHALHGVHHILRLVIVGVAQIGRPLDVLVHLRQHGREGAKGLHAGIPGVGVGAGRNLAGRGVALALQPAVGLHHLRGIGRSREHLRHQRIRIERDWRHQLIQLRFGHRLTDGGRRGAGRALRGNFLRKGRCLAHGNHDHQRTQQQRHSAAAGLRHRLRDGAYGFRRLEKLSNCFIPFHKSSLLASTWSLFSPRVMFRPRLVWRQTRILTGCCAVDRKLTLFGLKKVC